MVSLLISLVLAACAAGMVLVLQRSSRSQREVVEAWLRAQGLAPRTVAVARGSIPDPLWRTRFDVEAADAHGNVRRGRIAVKGDRVEVLVTLS